MRSLAKSVKMPRRPAIALLSIFSTSSSSSVCRADYGRPIFQGPLVCQSRQWYRSTTAGFSVPFDGDLLARSRNPNNTHKNGHFPTTYAFDYQERRHTIVVGGRRRSTSHLHENRDSTNNNTPTNNGSSLDPRSLAQDAFHVLARKGRSWRRLGHLVDLAVESCETTTTTTTTSIQSIADIGCDHGLLTVGLSVTGCFDHVIGVDVSEQALEDGGKALHKEVLHILRTKTTEEQQQQQQQENHPSNKHNNYNDDTSSSSSSDPQCIPVEFRVGDGLKVLQPKEADAVCIAGMGIHTMLQILTDAELSRLNCQKLILQPTNTKPRNLVQLYDELQHRGWMVIEERIEELSSRWYISTRLEKKKKTPGSDAEGRRVVLLPGDILRHLKDDDPMRGVYNDYVELHRSWLEQDLKRAGRLHPNEVRWLENNT